DVAQTKLRQIADLVLARPCLSLRMADGRDVHAEHAAPELPCQIARRAAGATPDVQHPRSRSDPGPQGEGRDFVCRQQAFLPDVRVAIGQGCYGQPAGSERVVKAARVRRLTLSRLSHVPSPAHGSRGRTGHSGAEMLARQVEAREAWQ